MIYIYVCPSKHRFESPEIDAKPTCGKCYIGRVVVPMRRDWQTEAANINLSGLR